MWFVADESWKARGRTVSDEDFGASREREEEGEGGKGEKARNERMSVGNNNNNVCVCVCVSKNNFIFTSCEIYESLSYQCMHALRPFTSLPAEARGGPRISLISVCLMMVRRCISRG